MASIVGLRPGSPLVLDLDLVLGSFRARGPRIENDWRRGEAGSRNSRSDSSESHLHGRAVDDPAVDGLSRVDVPHADGLSDGAVLEVTYQSVGGNEAPVADAGSDQQVTDNDDDGSETVTLDGSGSSDSDGSITSWVWTEGTSQLATGETAQVSLAVGQHTITLTVTDDDSATDDDTTVVTVNEKPNDPPVADAGGDQDLAGSLSPGEPQQPQPHHDQLQADHQRAEKR